MSCRISSLVISGKFPFVHFYLFLLDLFKRVVFPPNNHSFGSSIWSMYQPVLTRYHSRDRCLPIPLLKNNLTIMLSLFLLTHTETWLWEMTQTWSKNPPSHANPIPGDSKECEYGLVPYHPTGALGIWEKDWATVTMKWLSSGFWGKEG